MRIRGLVVAGASACAGLALVTGAASAVTAPTPALSACSDGKYACLSVNRAAVPAGRTVTFSGSLSAKALRNLHAWTKGADVVCLTRYAPKPQADGSWPWESLDGACAQVNPAGRFVIHAELGLPGTHYFGVENGPCRADAALCGNGDPGLVGLGTSAVSMTTT